MILTLRQPLAVAAGASIGGQVVVALASHWLEPVRANSMWLGLLVAALAGALYAWRAGAGWRWSLGGAALASAAGGAAGALLGAILSDVGWTVVLVATGSDALAGLLAGAIVKIIR